MKAGDAEKASAKIAFTGGRPNMKELLDNLPSSEKTCILACGPARMVDDVEKESIERDFHFHKETFAF